MYQLKVDVGMYVKHHEDLLSWCSSISPSSWQKRWTDNELYQLKVDVGVLNTVKIYWADVSTVNPLSEQKRRTDRQAMYYINWGGGMDFI